MLLASVAKIKKNTQKVCWQPAQPDLETKRPFSAIFFEALEPKYLFQQKYFEALEPKDLISKKYYEACGHLWQEITDWFKAEELVQPLVAMEQLIIRSANGKSIN